MRAFLLAAVVVAVYVLHQDFWWWGEARPLVFGFLPIWLFYHAAYTLAATVVMVLLARHAWPSHLDADDKPEE